LNQQECWKHNVDHYDPYFNFFYFNPYTVHFYSVCIISQQMHYSDMFQC
jgi:hypothetical protein